MSLHTNKYKQGVQEVKFDHLLNICHERIRGMVDGINIYTESSAGHHIHAVRSKHAAKRECQSGQAEGKGGQGGCWISDDACLESAALRGRSEAEEEEAGMKMSRFSLIAMRMETIMKDGDTEAGSRNMEKRRQKIGEEEVQTKSNKTKVKPFKCMLLS